MLITGGAGFIGRAVCRKLPGRGHRVRVLDSMIEQVHGDRERPEDFPDEAELIRGDVRNGDVAARAIAGVDSIIHLALEVGVGQSMYEVERYTSVNDVGSAVLLQKLIPNRVRRVVTASSMSIYGEGLYRDLDGDEVQDAVRQPHAAGSPSWDPVDAQGRPLHPLPTPERKRPDLASTYALGKYVQERQTLIMGAGRSSRRGVVDALGEGVHGPAPGDRVASPAWRASPACRCRRRRPAGAGCPVSHRRPVMGAKRRLQESGRSCPSEHGGLRIVTVRTRIGEETMIRALVQVQVGGRTV